MRYIKYWGVIVLLSAILLSGCSTESIMEQGSSLLDKMFAGESTSSVDQAPSLPDPDSTNADATPTDQEPGQAVYPEAVEPSIPEQPSTPDSQEPAGTQEPTPPASSEPVEDITPSHTDATFFGPGESFKYLPKGTVGVYACTYASEDESIATVDQNTGKVTAVGPGTTKVTMHVECSGQYDFECIVRCNWDNGEEEPSLPSESSESTPPADTKTPVSGTGTITASHSDATFFNPKEHFQFLPIGADDGYTCSYTADDTGIATVDETGKVTAVGPGTTTVTMTVDAGGTEYIFKCIVRCNFKEESTKS